MQSNSNKVSHKATLSGVVTSDKMDKTITVKVTRTTKHPMYNKVIKKYNRYKVHDEKNEAKVGSIVKIIQTRPLSKDKRWRLAGIVKQ